MYLVIFGFNFLKVNIISFATAHDVVKDGNTVTASFL